MSPTPMPMEEDIGLSENEDEISMNNFIDPILSDLPDRINNKFKEHERRGNSKAIAKFLPKHHYTAVDQLTGLLSKIKNLDRIDAISLSLDHYKT